MLNVVAGRLAKDPDLKQVDTAKGKMAVSNNTVYVWDGKKGSEGIPIKITAWGDQAKELVKYNKGDPIQFVGSVQAIDYQPKGLDKPIRTIGYSVQAIDHSKTLLTTHDEILQSYIRGGREAAQKKQVDGPEKETTFEKKKAADQKKKMDAGNEKEVAGGKKTEKAAENTKEQLQNNQPLEM